MAGAGQPLPRPVVIMSAPAVTRCVCHDDSTRTMAHGAGTRVLETTHYYVIPYLREHRCGVMRSAES